MKKMSISKSYNLTLDDMLPEYDFDYQKASPNRFTGQISKNQVVVILDPDISDVFTTAKSVNTVLRALITTMAKVPMHRIQRQTLKKAEFKTKGIGSRP